ncbi:MAG: transporter substrate-binding domain-containing protein, partial [Firmicutes bacterium]|nr:transporter substrate-binding domain-containing protein [Bacillota bacterium]
MKKNIAKVSSLLLAALLLLTNLTMPAAVFAEQAPTKNGITSIEELNGKDLGVQTGVLYEDHIKDDLEGETWYYYKMPNDMIPALESNKIDAYLIEEVGFYAQRFEHPELVRLEEPVGVSDFAVIVGNNDKQDRLFAELQEFIAQGRENGWLDKLYDYWVINWNPNTCKIENIPETTGENGTVSIAIEGGYEPFSFESNGEFSGYDVEFMMNFCAAYGYNWEFHAMEFDSIAPAVIAGKYDFGMNIVVDEERAEASVLTDPYYSCDIVFVLEGVTEDGVHFMDGIKDSFYKTFIKEDRWKLFAQGIGTTLLITLCSIAFGTLFGFAVYMLCRHGNPLANRVMNVFDGFIHGIPTVVFL